MPIDPGPLERFWSDELALGIAVQCFAEVPPPRLEEAKRKSPALGGAMLREFASYAFGRFRLRVATCPRWIPITSSSGPSWASQQSYPETLNPARFSIQRRTRFSRVVEGPFSTSRFRVWVRRWWPYLWNCRRNFVAQWTQIYLKIKGQIVIYVIRTKSYQRINFICLTYLQIVLANSNLLAVSQTHPQKEGSNDTEHRPHRETRGLHRY